MKLVIFDCDGTLVDSQYVIMAAMEEAFRGKGLEPPSRERVLDVVGLSLVTAVAKLLPEDDPGLAMQLAEDYKISFGQRRLGPDHREPLYPGIRELVLNLNKHPHVRLGIATGKSRRGVNAVLEHEGLTSCFSTVQTADTHPSKPHPSMILQAMAETGSDAVDTVVIGDTTYDMMMARGAGATAVGVAWGYHAEGALHGAGAHRVCADALELVGVLDNFVHERMRA